MLPAMPASQLRLTAVIGARSLTRLSKAMRQNSPNKLDGRLKPFVLTSAYLPRPAPVSAADSAGPAIDVTPCMTGVQDEGMPFQVALSCRFGRADSMAHGHEYGQLDYLHISIHIYMCSIYVYIYMCVYVHARRTTDGQRLCT